MTELTTWLIPEQDQRVLTLKPDFRIGNELALTLIAGPCVLENRQHARLMAEALKTMTEKHQLHFIFKASFDKANRSQHDAARGVGIDEGLDILATIAQDYACPVLTDVHEAQQCAAVAQAVDIIQIPAFLCRQTDLLHAAADTGKIINIKKGQFLAPWDMKHVINKVTARGNHNILITERGSCFGYNMLVNDMRSLALMARFGYPIVFDATHSVQLPGGGAGEGRSNGHSIFVPALARAATAVGIACLFTEVHDHPQRALSDGGNMLDLHQLDRLLEQVVRLDNMMKTL